MTRTVLIPLALLAVASTGTGAGGCGPSAGGATDDTGLDGLALSALGPTTLLPGSRLQIDGRSFVDAVYGTSRLRLVGAVDGTPVDLVLPASFVDYDELEVSWDGASDMGFPSDEGTFDGDATVEVDSTVDGKTHASPPLGVTLRFRAALEPRLDVVSTGIIFVNDPISVQGDGLLLGADEGKTVAVVEGCYTAEGQAGCVPVGPVEVEVTPETPFDRTHGTFPFAPKVAGITPGHFDGMVTLKNLHGDAAGAVELSSAPQLVTYDVIPPTVFSIAPAVASLGQYVEIRGGGFVGVRPDDPDQTSLVTLLELDGTFTAEGTGTGLPVTITLVPEFVSGPLARYVMNEDDELGTRVDLRTIAGSFVGTIRPIIQSGGMTVTGDTTNVTLGIGHVKQVVWLNFMPSYVESLRHFGLRAVDAQIRQRVLDVAERDYAGVNVEFRTSAPTDFAYFARVDLSGPDPNGLGLLGYDNSPGKDLGNERLYDQIGGVNATTQEDGYPGFGGVFVESFFGFSEHPGTLAAKIDGADPLFDQVFDPFRPDRDGRPVLAADLGGGGVPALTSGDGCPADSGDRTAQIACAVWVLGSMIGTTLTHEVGHSLGLANPDQPMAFHNDGDEPNRLMDSGSGRTFTERSELQGDGPARFCDEEYEYLRQILPSSAPASTVTRPGCH